MKPGFSPPCSFLPLSRVVAGEAVRQGALWSLVIFLLLASLTGTHYLDQLCGSSSSGEFSRGPWTAGCFLTISLPRCPALLLSSPSPNHSLGYPLQLTCSLWGLWSPEQHPQSQVLFRVLGLPIRCLHCPDLGCSPREVGRGPLPGIPLRQYPARPHFLLSHLQAVSHWEGRATPFLGGCVTGSEYPTLLTKAGRGQALVPSKPALVKERLSFLSCLPSPPPQAPLTFVLGGRGI